MRASDLYNKCLIEHWRSDRTVRAATTCHRTKLYLKLLETNIVTSQGSWKHLGTPGGQNRRHHEEQTQLFMMEIKEEKEMKRVELTSSPWSCQPEVLVFRGSGCLSFLFKVCLQYQTGSSRRQQRAGLRADQRHSGKQSIHTDSWHFQSFRTGCKRLFCSFKIKHPLWFEHWQQNHQKNMFLFYKSHKSPEKLKVKIWTSRNVCKNVNKEEK